MQAGDTPRVRALVPPSTPAWIPGMTLRAELVLLTGITLVVLVLRVRAMGGVCSEE